MRSEDITLEDIFGPEKPRNRTKKPGELKATTAKARELFLFGNGDGRPVRDMAKLAQISGASPRTLETWFPVWKRESESLAKAENAGKRGQVASVTEAELAWHADKVATLKSEVERLQTAVKKFPAGSDIHADTLKLLNATLARWEQSSGFAAYADCQATLAKEMIKTAQRAAGKITDSDKPRTVPGFTFNVSPELPGPRSE